jgi:hypothetical protein
MDKFSSESATPLSFGDSYLDPDDAIASAPLLFPANDTQEFSPAPNNFADLLPVLDLDGNSHLNKAELKAAQFNDSLSQMQMKMIDWLGTRYDQVRLLGPTDMGADNLEISVSDLDEVNKVAMDGYDLKNFISTTFQNLGEIPNGFFIASAAQVGIGTLFKVPFLVQMGTAGLTLSTGAAGVKSLMDSAENKAMQSELESILIDDSPLS